MQRDHHFIEIDIYTNENNFFIIFHADRFFMWWIIWLFWVDCKLIWNINIVFYRCIISEDTGYILAGGTTLKIFYLNNSGRIKYLQSIDLAINGKLLDIIVLHSNVYRLLIVENSGVLIYNIDKDNYQCVKCNFKHRNKDILIRSDSGFTYRPYLFLPDNGLLLIQDTYANVFYKYQLPLEFYVPKPFAEIRKNARILHQGFDMSFLPAEMWILILSYSGYLYSKSLARKLAGTFFTKPLLWF